MQLFNFFAYESLKYLDSDIFWYTECIYIIVLYFNIILSFEGASESIFSEDKAQLLDDGRGSIVTWNVDYKLSIESQRQRLPIFQKVVGFQSFT